MDTFHTSVLLNEAVDALEVSGEKRYIDATLGGGGHTYEIVRRGGIVLGIDADIEAIEHVKKKIESYEARISKNIRIVQGNFSDIERIAREHGFLGVDGILFDLGVSSFQLTSARRGFSLQHDGPLDMRMDKTLSVSAKDLVNGLHAKELMTLFQKYAEEPFARKIAYAIVATREIKQFETTRQLAELIHRVVGRREDIHPATRVFQALRIAVNDELHRLEDALKQCPSLLKSGGKLAVISFHSLEDRIVKHVFDNGSEMLAVNKKPITPTPDEIRANKRARSAKLRIFQKP